MKRNVVVLAVVLSLMVLLSSTAGVVADTGGDPHEGSNGEGRGDAPHNGGCVAYCARTPKADRDGDGKFGNCLVDLHCHKFSPFAPEVVCNRDPAKPCVDSCLLIHGEDTHGRGH